MNRKNDQEFAQKCKVDRKRAPQKMEMLRETLREKQENN